MNKKWQVYQVENDEVEKLQEKYKHLFEPQIIYRGRDYFENGKIKSVYKLK